MTTKTNAGIFHVVTVKDDERGFLMRDGKFERLLEPGRFRAFDLGRHLTSEVVNVVRSEIAPERALFFEKTQPELAARHFVIVKPSATEVAIVSFDGEPRHIVLPNTTRAFWKTLTQVDVDMIDTAVEPRVAKRHLDKLDLRGTTVAQAVVEAHEAGLLFIDGQLKERLGPGRHAFWQIGRTVRIGKVDLRPQPHEVTAQEIMTKDRVGIRVTLTAFTRVTDPEKSTLASADLNNTVYRLIQSAIREAVATRTLDEILAARDTIDKEVRTYVTERVKELGIEIGEIGVKDVILPGDVRDLMSKVVDAERVAKANLIRRQEETAVTRSLLNTSRGMDENPLLQRLKELEALEKLVEKAGRNELQGGQSAGSLETLLANLYRLQNDKEKDKTPDKA